MIRSIEFNQVHWAIPAVESSMGWFVFESGRFCFHDDDDDQFFTISSSDISKCVCARVLRIYLPLCL